MILSHLTTQNQLPEVAVASIACGRQPGSIITAGRYAGAVFAVNVIACLSVRQSVTSRYCLKTAERRLSEVLLWFLGC